jgi:hypothetical protein
MLNPTIPREEYREQVCLHVALEPTPTIGFYATFLLLLLADLSSLGTP